MRADPFEQPLQFAKENIPYLRVFLNFKQTVNFILNAFYAALLSIVLPQVVIDGRPLWIQKVGHWPVCISVETFENFQTIELYSTLSGLSDLRYIAAAVWTPSKTAMAYQG